MHEPENSDVAVPDLWSSELGFRLGLPPVEQTANGDYLARVKLDETLFGHRDTVFGGWLACLVDHVAGVATATHLGPAADFLTATLNIDFLHPIGRGELTVTASLRGVGTRLAEVSVLVEQCGIRCCRAQLTQVIRGNRCVSR